MNRVALVWLMVATLVGCGGGSKSAPNTPDPGREMPPSPSGSLERQSEHEGGPIAGSGNLGGNSESSTPVQPEVDRIELLTPPFEHNQTERFLLHLVSPAYELMWRAASRDFLFDVRSDQGENHSEHYDPGDGELLYVETVYAGGTALSCFVTGVEEVEVECTIWRSDAVSTVSTSFMPVYTPPGSHGTQSWGIVGASGEQHTWGRWIQDLYEDVTWDFGGGGLPNTWQGATATTVLGAPGRYTGTRTIRNDWGWSGPQQFSYWVQPLLSTHSLDMAINSTPSLLWVDDRILMLLPTSEGHRFGEALTALPESASDWRFSELPLTETHTRYMQLGLYHGQPMIIGGQGESGQDEIQLYYLASTPSPRSPADWDVGGIPGSHGMQILDQEFEEVRVGLLVRQSGNLLLLWNESPVLSDWQVSEVAHAPNPGIDWGSNRLLLPPDGPIIVGREVLPGEAKGLTFRSSSYSEGGEWLAHRVLGFPPRGSSDVEHMDCIYQDRPLVLASLEQDSTVLLWSSFPHPTRTEHWDRLVTCSEFRVTASSSYASIDVQGDQILMSPIGFNSTTPEGYAGWSTGGLLVQGKLAELSDWTPFLPPNLPAIEKVWATVLTDNGIGVLSTIDGDLRFGMLTP